MIDYKDIKPGFYIVAYENESESLLLANVYGKVGFLKIDTWEPIIKSAGVLKADHDMSKKPLVFLERLTQLDKEKEDDIDI